MAKQSLKLAAVAGVMALGVSSAAFEVDAADLMSGASARMLAETCAGCHGPDGASAGPAIPTIGGMYGDYFVELMNGYKSGDVYGTIMGRIAKGYSEEEIELMAAFFAEKPYKPAAQKFDEGLAQTGAKLHDKYCEKCHSDGGKVLEDEEYYILGGQWVPYLHNAMQDYIQERREWPKKMKSQVDKLLGKEGEKGLEALYAYYASLQ